VPANETTFAAPAPQESEGTRSGVAVLLAGFFEWFGEVGAFFARLARAMVRPPYEWKELLHQCDAVGSLSLPLVALAGAATGVVLSMETRDSLTRFGAKSMLPAVIVFSILKESGPVITGLVVSGRVGAGIGAELGSMKVTEQIDAMEASAVDPFRYLVATRVLACVLMMPLLTLAADFFGVLMGWVANNLQDSISLRQWLQERRFQRLPAAHREDHSVWPHHRHGGVLRGNEDAGRHGRGGTIDHAIGGAGVFVCDSGGCLVGPVDSGSFPLRRCGSGVHRNGISSCGGESP